MIQAGNLRNHPGAVSAKSKGGKKKKHPPQSRNPKKGEAAAPSGISRATKKQIPPEQNMLPESTPFPSLGSIAAMLLLFILLGSLLYGLESLKHELLGQAIVGHSTLSEP